MNKSDRGIIKWAPFNSFTNSKELVNDILKEKKKIKKPILTEEQKNILEKKIIEIYYENIPISLEYFQNGELKFLNEYIKKIDFTFHKIYFESEILIFDQIINIY